MTRKVKSRISLPFTLRFPPPPFFPISPLSPRSAFLPYASTTSVDRLSPPSFPS